MLVKFVQAPMLTALIAAPVVAGLGAMLFGWFAVRLSGIYLAMLTLAFAQIVWSIVFQWQDFTGGSHGVLGIWPSPPLHAPRGLFLPTPPGAPGCVGPLPKLRVFPVPSPPPPPPPSPPP